ncbi:hypothetical protein QAD02_006389 [Eretmocerus hayati]|uniref:Uncharacterized protein n=1 Tax=Eretmocerus hayati TaxID=131215 RepID=A0ACC2N0U7_9HYME|nr:hypothetical protein QAD02_006389 [Eretmocerus hayati]
MISESRYYIVKKNGNEEYNDDVFFARDLDEGEATCYQNGAPILTKVKDVTYLVGFSNGNVNDCQNNGYGIYVNIAKYYKWMLQYLEELANPANLFMRPSFRIAGGNQAKIEDHPYEVSIERDDETYCAGSIVDKNHVVTSAYCGSLIKFNSKSIRAGSNQRGNNSGDVYTVASVKLHEDYNPTTLENNIAIIRIREEFKGIAKPILPNIDSSNVITGSEGIVSGWGKLNVLEKTDTLREVKMKVIDKVECGKVMEAPRDKEFCAGDLNLGKATCYGDAGAPFVKMIGSELRLIGFLSWRVGNCHGDRPDVYINIADYANWITFNMNQS